MLQPKECIVCRARKTATSSSGYEDLVKCSTSPGSSSLISFFEGCLNEHIQAQLAGLTVEEIKAKEFYYHRSTQRDIIRENGNIDKKEVNSRKECFDKLAQHVRHPLIKNRQFSTVSELSALYAQFQVERNINIKGVLQKDITRRLKQEFGDSFIIKVDRKVSLYTTKVFQLRRMKEAGFFSPGRRKGPLTSRYN